MLHIYFNTFSDFQLSFWIMEWHGTGDKPPPGPMVTHFADTPIHIRPHSVKIKRIRYTLFFTPNVFSFTPNIYILFYIDHIHYLLHPTYTLSFTNNILFHTPRRFAFFSWQSYQSMKDINNTDSCNNKFPLKFYGTVIYNKMIIAL